MDMVQAEPSLSPLGAGAPAELSPNGIAAIVAAVRATDPDAMDMRGHKAPEFSSTNFEDWHNWRERFDGYVAMNRWSHTRARQEPNVALTGDMRQRIRSVQINIQVPAGQPAPNYRMALNEIEAKLLPEADSELIASQPAPLQAEARRRHRSLSCQTHLFLAESPPNARYSGSRTRQATYSLDTSSWASCARRPRKGPWTEDQSSTLGC